MLTSFCSSALSWNAYHVLLPSAVVACSPRFVPLQCRGMLTTFCSLAPSWHAYLVLFLCNVVACSPRFVPLQCHGMLTINLPAVCHTSNSLCCTLPLHCCTSSLKFEARTIHTLSLSHPPPTPHTLTYTYTYTLTHPPIHTHPHQNTHSPPPTHIPHTHPHQHTNTPTHTHPQTYNVHTDSVWALQASDDWSMVYSGGRDKCVYRTHLSSRNAELLAREEHPVRKMALDQNVSNKRVWVSCVLSGRVRARVCVCVCVCVTVRAEVTHSRASCERRASCA